MSVIEQAAALPPPNSIRIERVANGFVVIVDGAEYRKPGEIMSRDGTFVFENLESLTDQVAAWWKS